MIDGDAIRRVLADPDIVRFPVQLAFGTTELLPGEFAWPKPRGASPAEGYDLVLHPAFRDREDALPFLIAYHVVAINYLDVATHEEAELFGAALLGMDVDAYYSEVCRLADEALGAPSPAKGGEGACCGGTTCS